LVEIMRGCKLMKRSLFVPGLVLLTAVTAAGPAAAQGAADVEVTRCERAYEFRNYVRAHDVCRSPAEAGAASAQFILGVMFQEGLGVRQNGDEAVAWYTRAAEQGHAEAQFNLGTMYRYGRGVWQDFVEAFAWFDVAVDAQHPDAAASRDVVARRLSPAQLGDAERRAAALRRTIEIAQAPSGDPDHGPDTGPQGDDRTQELVDRLRPIIQQADEDRSASPRLIRQLREVVREYDWPWRVTLLDDDFRDGDFTADPAWTVIGGNFRVERWLGLRTQFTPRRRKRDSRSGEQDFTTRLFGAIVTEATRDSNRDDRRRRLRQAEIHTEVGISNAFAVRVELVSFGNEDLRGAFQLGPYQGSERITGYRLEYNSGKRPFVQLMRILPGGSAVIELADLEAALEDSKPHLLEWRRDRDGEMVVLIDGNELMRALDRGIQQPFDGLTFVNLGGEYGVRRLTVSGTSQ
jgi:hypothetical protein